jgi:hypothetical protein
MLRGPPSRARGARSALSFSTGELSRAASRSACLQSRTQRKNHLFPGPSRSLAIHKERIKVGERLGLALIYMTSYSRTHESHQKLRLSNSSMVLKSFQAAIFFMALNYKCIFSLGSVHLN